jgi:hypothetical protein
VRMSEPVLCGTLALGRSCSRPSTRTRARRPSSRRLRHPGRALGKESAPARSSTSIRSPCEAEGLDAAARDFLAGMTDRYAVSLFEELFVPRSWSV